jgi:hypothetical protein
MTYLLRVTIDEQKEQVLLVGLLALREWLKATTRETSPRPGDGSMPPGNSPCAGVAADMQTVCAYSGLTHHRGHEIQATTRGQPDMKEAVAWTDIDWFKHDAISGVCTRTEAHFPYCIF